MSRLHPTHFTMPEKPWERKRDVQEWEDAICPLCGKGGYVGDDGESCEHEPHPLGGGK